MSELRLSSTERVRSMLELVEYIHRGKTNAQKPTAEDGKEALEAIREQVAALANQATEARDEAVLHAERIEENMKASLVGPMFDRIRSEMHDMQQRISALEMAVNGKTVRTGRRNK